MVSARSANITSRLSDPIKTCSEVSIEMPQATWHSRCRMGDNFIQRAYACNALFGLEESLCVMATSATAVHELTRRTTPEFVEHSTKRRIALQENECDCGMMETFA